jgi:hypothetical protein
LTGQIHKNLWTKRPPRDGRFENRFRYLVICAIFIFTSCESDDLYPEYDSFLSGDLTVYESTVTLYHTLYFFEDGVLKSRDEDGGYLSFQKTESGKGSLIYHDEGFTASYPDPSFYLSENGAGLQNAVHLSIDTDEIYDTLSAESIETHPYLFVYDRFSNLLISDTFFLP